MNKYFGINEILDDVAARHQTRRVDLLCHVQTGELRDARAEAYWRLQSELGWGTSRIAFLFARDHSSIVKAIKRHRDNIATTE